MPVVTLSNGLRVANFSSGHPFEFADGSILPACQNDRVLAGSVNPMETVVTRRGAGESSAMFDVVTLTPHLTDDCRKMLDDTYRLANLSVDIVIIPLMLLEAIKRYKESLGNVGEGWYSHCYTIRRTHRNGPICIDKFCR